MLAIRFQRVGRKGHAEYRIIVQEAQRSPSSGRIVAQIGHHNPHSKVTVLDKEKAALYVGNGAQPSPRVASLMKTEGVKLPSWVQIDSGKKRTIKNTDKLRRNRPAEAAAPVAAAEEAPVAEEAAPATEEAVVETAEATPEADVATEEVAEAPAAEAEETPTETAA